MIGGFERGGGGGEGLAATDDAEPCLYNAPNGWRRRAPRSISLSVSHRAQEEML